MRAVAPAFPSVEGPGDSPIPGMTGAVEKEGMPTSQIPGLVPDSDLLNRENDYDPNTYTPEDMVRKGYSRGRPDPMKYI